MKVNKKIKIDADIDTGYAMSVLKNYIEECEMKPRQDGYSGMIIYTMRTGEHLCVYKTATMFVIRTA